MSSPLLYNDAKSLISDGDIRNGVIKMKEAAESGSVKASSYLGFGYYVGKNGLPQDYEAAEHYLHMFLAQAEASNRDVPDAHLSLGCIHYFGKTGKKDIKRALYHFKQGAEGGNPVAAYYYRKASEKRDDKLLKWVLMPLIFLTIATGALLTLSLGWNETLVSIVCTVVVILLVLAFIFLRRH